MALRTLVEVPAGLRNSFTAVPAARRMSLCPTWDESWPEWAKKNPRVPEQVFGLDWGNLQHFTKEMMKEIKGLPNPELAVQHLVRKIGEYFALLEPVELNLAELSMQLRANMSDDGGFKPCFDSMAHIGRIQAQGGAKKEYETRVWQLYFIAVELDKDSSIGRTEDRVDILDIYRGPRRYPRLKKIIINKNFGACYFQLRSMQLTIFGSPKGPTVVSDVNEQGTKRTRTDRSPLGPSQMDEEFTLKDIMEAIKSLKITFDKVPEMIWTE
jgi:hypothetical protein